VLAHRGTTIWRRIADLGHVAICPVDLDSSQQVMLICNAIYVVR